MKSKAELLELYKEEKALVIGAPDERTGLEEFPDFQTWVAQYEAEYNETHVTVDTKDADKLADETVAEADAELEKMVDELAPELDELEAAEAEEAEEEDEKEPAPSEPKGPALEPVIGGPVKPKAAPKKRSTRKAAPKKTAAKKATKKVTKKAKGEKIFTKHFGKAGWTRAKIINKLVAEAGLTHNGAATYYQTMKKKAEAK